MLYYYTVLTTMDICSVFIYINMKLYIYIEYIRSGVSVEDEVRSDVNLNNAEWQDVSVNFNQDNLTVTLNNCISAQCEVTHNITGVTGVIGRLYIEGAPSSMMRMTNVCPNLIGCMQDVVVGPDWIIPDGTRLVCRY